jgi:superfamily II DNA or RNA helicase
MTKPRTLWPHQSRAIEQIRAAFENHRRVAYQLPTGGGKTDIMCAIAAGAISYGFRVRFDTHRKELVRQICRRLELFGVKPAVIASGYPSDEYAQCQVASIDTYARRLGQYGRFDLIFRDECHHSPSNKWRNSLDGDASHILGVSATPRRLDGKGLSDDYDTLICGPTVPDLIRDGFLVQPLVYAPPLAFDRSSLRSRGGDFAKDDVTAALEKTKSKIFGDAIAHYKEICPGTAAIAFCHSVEAAHEFAEKCNAAGIKAAAVDGTMSDYQREMYLDNLDSGAIQVLANCELLGEGVDVPRVETVILMRPTMSESLFLQQCGRGLRADRERDKRYCYVLDHVGNCHEHGLPDEPRTWTLQGKTPRSKGDTAEVTPATVTCRNCFAMFRPAPTCPRCGAEMPKNERELKMIDGQLMLISDPALLKREEKARAKQELDLAIGRARTLDDFKQIAKERDYAPNWAYFQFSMRQRKMMRKKA